MIKVLLFFIFKYLDILLPFHVRGISWHPKQHMVAVAAVCILLLFQSIKTHCHITNLFKVGPGASLLIYCAEKERYIFEIILTIYICIYFSLYVSIHDAAIRRASQIDTLAIISNSESESDDLDVHESIEGKPIVPKTRLSRLRLSQNNSSSRLSLILRNGRDLRSIRKSINLRDSGS